MKKKKTARAATTAYKRQLFSLPRNLVGDLDKYAAICRGGNKSGFVADALEAYIKSLRRYRHTQKLRQGYTAAAKHSLAINKEWEHLDDEVWARLDQLEASANT